MFARDPWGYTYCHITNCLQDVLDNYCNTQATDECNTAYPVRYARFHDGKWKCVAHLTVDVLPVSDDLTNIPLEDISLHEPTCVSDKGDMINCQPAGNSVTHHGGEALHCDQHDMIMSLIDSNKNCGPTTTPVVTTTTPATTTTDPETCVNTNDFNFCPDWHSCDIDIAQCIEDPDTCPELPISWKGGKYSTVVMKGIGAYAVRINIPNGQDEYDIRALPYSGFMMWSRRYCGAAFTDALISGQAKMMIMDYESAYEVKYSYERKDKQQSSITIQFEQTHIAELDLPLLNGVNSQGKDQFFLYLYNMEDIVVKDEEKCFQIAIGVLPTNYPNRNTDLTLCAGWQKDVGF